MKPFLYRGPGVYAIINSANLKVYIGSSNRVSWRWNQHLCELRAGEHHSLHLQRSFKINPGAFQFEVIEEVKEPSQLEAREQFWINFFQSHNRDFGYNVSPSAGTCRGVKRSPEFIKKVSKSLSKPYSEERKISYRKARALNQPRGWKWSEASKLNQSQRLKGTTNTPNQIEKWKRAISSNPHRFNRKAVLQLDAKGTVIRKFEQIEDAEAHFGKRSNIHAVCKGKRRECFGFSWRYADAT